MEWVKVFFQILIFAVVAFALYSILRKTVLHKLKVNKWIVFTVMIVVFIVTALFQPQLDDNVYLKYLTQGIFILLFLWFLDLSGFTKRVDARAKKNAMVIKPKAKPNRVKNNKQK